jgi:uncharacterized membrane protein YoaK (UPF0700 family)
MSLPATTTAQEDIVTAGQRQINLIWERTQSLIAIFVVGANMASAMWNVFKGQGVDVPPIMSSAMFLILGFYFARTNHQAIGGVGKKPEQPYEGR